MLDQRQLFHRLYSAPTEGALDAVIAEYPALADPANWSPYGDNENNYGVVENQQASPIPALVEKVTNAIDAILMRRCHEEGIDPRSPEAPQSIDEAVERFFPDSSNWDLGGVLKEQAGRIQIIADGPKLRSAVVVYDEGEGQHPDQFEHTFLSLLRGNKNEIPFVQGKYNMGGAGALVFCGKKRYQLVGSRRHTGGPFGFTLVRRHPMTDHERATKKNTWYEFLTLGGQIPRFEMADGDTLDLGLYGRPFETGTVLKLYSYDLPKGSRAIFSRDLNQSVNEYLFDPALPVLTVDHEARYPNDRNLQRPLYGLKRRLESETYLDHPPFTETVSRADVGTFRVTCYVFKARIEGKSVKETKRTIRDEFFKNGMSVLFSLNGQVHGSFSTEFITRTLKYPLLRDYLLIHVDCTDLRLEFRNELFMASRDRLKQGEEASVLRGLVAEALKGSALKEIYRRRRQSLAVDGDDAEALLRNVARNLPLNKDLARLLDQSLRLDRGGAGRPDATRPRPKPSAPDEGFEGRRFPSFLRVDVKEADAEGTPVVRIPLGGSRTIRLATDVEDEYLDRTDEPGDLRVELLDVRPPSGDGGGEVPGGIGGVFNVTKSSPDRGTIRVRLAPAEGVEVGESARVRVTLTGAGESFEGVFWARVTEKQKRPAAPRPEPDPSAGLPPLVTVRESPGDGEKSWDDAAEAGVTFDHDTVMYPLAGEDDTLAAIYVNLDSRVLKDYRSKQRSPEQMEVAQRRFISAVYFHTLFLYAILRSRGYEVRRGEDGGGGDPPPVDLGEYLKDVFESAYAEFLLNFEMTELMAALE